MVEEMQHFGQHMERGARRSETTAQSALEGIKILDFTQMMLGPYGTQFLGDYGADVIKVERPGVGEWERGLRAMGRLLRDENSAFFMAMNRNKRGITLNLKSPEAIAAIYRMVETVDVVVENFRPGVMEKLGLGYQKLSGINPGLVYASGSGYGASGPYSMRPGQDLLIQALSGMASNTGTGDDAPTPLGSAIVDASTALMLALHTMIALFHKQRTGRGQKVEVSLFGTAISVQCQELSAYLNLGIGWKRSNAGIAQPWLSAPYGVYPTTDGHVAIAMSSLSVLGRLLALPVLSDYDDPESSYAHRDEIKRLIEAETAKLSREQLVNLLLSSDIWCAPVQDFSDLTNDPQVEASELVIEVDHPDAGRLLLVGHPAKLSSTPATIRYPPPRVGEHTDRVLTEFGFTASEIVTLRERGAI